MAKARAPKAEELAPDGWEDQDIWSDWKPPVRIVKGTQRRQQAFIDVIGPCRDGGYRQPSRVTIERDIANQADRNAIKVLLEGEHVGFLEKLVASRVAPVMDERGIEAFDVPAIVVGGSEDKPNFGVWIFATKCFRGGMRLSPYCSGEDYRVSSDAWDWYCSWEDDDTPPDDEDDEYDPTWQDALDAVDRAVAARRSLEAAKSSKRADPANPLMASVHPALAFLIVVLVMAFVLYCCRDVYFRAPLRKRASAPAITAKMTAKSCHSMAYLGIFLASSKPRLDGSSQAKSKTA